MRSNSERFEPSRSCVALDRRSRKEATQASQLQTALILGHLLLIGGCHPTPPASTQTAFPIAPQPVQSAIEYQPESGPTLMSRVADGYELKNQKFRIVISDQTGDVIFWGYVGQDRNMVFHRGIYTTLTALPDFPPHMMAQPRDEQTWEFYGEDANHIIWRKSYCLQNDMLLVSVLILNNRPDALDTAIQINGDLPSLRITHHDPEQFNAAGGFGTVSLHGYNEFHTPTSQPALPTLIQSDTFHLKPQERQGYTSVWMLIQ